MIPPPEDVETRDRWRASLDRYVERKERTRQLREQLAAARAAGKERLHDDRLRRVRTQGRSKR